VLETPAFAAVSTAVKLAERDPKTRPYKNLVNAVLRGVEREGPGLTTAESNLPDWIAARWKQTYGDQALIGLALAAREEPADRPQPQARSGRRRPRRGRRGRGPAGRLGPHRQARRRRRLARASRTGTGGSRTPPPPSRPPAAPKAGETALDMCAAPGGKTLQIAATGATVQALDRSDARLNRLRQNLARTGLEAAIAVMPAEDWLDSRTFDAVLLDAPCTATGTFRRNPEVLRATKPAGSRQAGRRPAPSARRRRPARRPRAAVWSIASARWSARRARPRSSPSCAATRPSAP
jgi:16S rRNA (cytosine967-C5)-methyltransferase